MTLPDYFMVGDNGDLYDTRLRGWHELPPIRERYACHYQEINNTLQLRATLRAGKYSWPGGYEIFFITDEGGTLSYDAVKDEYFDVSDSIRNNINDGWRVVSCACTANCYDTIVCDHSGVTIWQGYDDG